MSLTDDIKWRYHYAAIRPSLRVKTMDMSTPQETFVKTALETASKVDVRWFANQALFNGPDDAQLQATAKAAIIGSVAILAQAHELDQEIVAESLTIATKGDARALIDKVHSLVPEL